MRYAKLSLRHHDTTLLRQTAVLRVLHIAILHLDSNGGRLCPSDGNAILMIVPLLKAQKNDSRSGKHISHQSMNHQPRLFEVPFIFRATIHDSIWTNIPWRAVLLIVAFCDNRFFLLCFIVPDCIGNIHLQCMKCFLIFCSLIGVMLDVFDADQLHIFHWFPV